MARLLRGNSVLPALFKDASGCPNRQRRRLLRKLPDCRQRAEREKRVEPSFQNVSACFFRLNQQSVCPSLFHNCFPFVPNDATERCFCLSSLSVIIALKN